MQKRKKLMTLYFDSENNKAKHLGFSLCALRDVTPGCQDPSELKRCSGCCQEPVKQTQHL